MSDEVTSEATKYFVIESITVVFGGDGVIFFVNCSLLYAVLFHKVEEWLITKHLYNSKLMFIPILRITCLNIDLCHIELIPVNEGAPFADESTKCHVEMSTFILLAIDTILVESIFCDYTLN